MDAPQSPPRLVALRLVNFKSFVDETLPLRAGLTLLVGANASGKSNALEAFQLLHALSMGHPLHDALSGVKEGPRGSWPGIRGRSEGVCHRGSHHFGITTIWQHGEQQMSHDLLATSHGQPQILKETLSDNEAIKDWINTEDFSRQNDPINPKSTMFVINKEYMNMDSLRYVDNYSSKSTILTQINPIVLNNVHFNRNLSAHIHGLLAALRHITTYELDPAALREPGHEHAEALGRNGSELSAILHRLVRQEGREAALIGWISQLCAPQVVGLTFSKMPVVGDMLLLLEEADGTIVPAPSLSDGTLRFLGLLAAILSAQPGALLLFEEPETGLHPTRAALLLELLDHLAQERGCQVIATTHAPHLLQALQDQNPEAFGEVVVFGRPEGHPGSVIRRLKDLPHFEVLQAGPVDELFGTGWLEQAL